MKYDITNFKQIKLGYMFDGMSRKACGIYLEQIHHLQKVTDKNNNNMSYFNLLKIFNKINIQICGQI